MIPPGTRIAPVQAEAATTTLGDPGAESKRQRADRE
jgi:hypothetical protein